MNNVPIFIQPLDKPYYQPIPNVYLNIYFISKIEKLDNSMSSVFVDGIEYTVYNDDLYKHIKVDKNTY